MGGGEESGRMCMACAGGLAKWVFALVSAAGDLCTTSPLCFFAALRWQIPAFLFPVFCFLIH